MNLSRRATGREPSVVKPFPPGAVTEEDYSLPETNRLLGLSPRREIEGILAKKMKVLVILGTRPEAIKLAPVIHELKKHEHEGVEVRICLTGQHRELLAPFLELFDLKPHYNLELMEPDQTPTGLAARALRALEPILQREQPDQVLVQGDTTTALASTPGSG